VPVGAFEAAIRGGAVPIVVDVRTAEEFAQGHVPGARNIPVDQLEARLAELEPYKAGGVYVICQTGGRSARAASELSGHGFRAYNVLGGTAGWKTGGFPIETSSP
jgi:rhodanese-related sulfurtransferase